MARAFEWSHRTNTTSTAPAPLRQAVDLAQAKIRVEYPDAPPAAIRRGQGDDDWSGTGDDGGKDDYWWVRFYVDDGILVEVSWSVARCMFVSALLIADHYRLLVLPTIEHPSVVSAKKLS